MISKDVVSSECCKSCTGLMKIHRCASALAYLLTLKPKAEAANPKALSWDSMGRGLNSRLQGFSRLGQHVVSNAAKELCRPYEIPRCGAALAFC